MIPLKTISFLLLLNAFFIQCQKFNVVEGIPSESEQPIFYGKNKILTRIDGDDREYFVHIPKSYMGKIAVPMVFMLHGTSGDGEEFYNRSGWREVGDTENIISVFPSSWRYCIHTDGETKNTTKWNISPDAEWTFCNGQSPRNDIKFLNVIINEMGAKYTIDNKRIYLVGFSNGGQMAAKCSIELSDKLAAVVQNASSFYLDTIYTPKRNLPVMYQVGNEDYGPGNTGPAIPMDRLSFLISTPGLDFYNGKFHTIAKDHIRNFSLSPKFTISGDTSKATVATYMPLAANAKYEFQYVMVKGLKHAYPNGENHPMEAAKIHWLWMKRFSL